MSVLNPNMVIENIGNSVMKFILQINVKCLKNVLRNIVISDTPSCAITLRNTRDVNLAYTVRSCKKHDNKSQDTNKEIYDDICEEVEKTKS